MISNAPISDRRGNADKEGQVKIASEIEIWKSARVTVAHFGGGARARAQTRAEECMSRADIDGWVTWMRIAATIVEMEGGIPR